MSHFHKIGELADLWGFSDEETLYNQVIIRGTLKAAFHHTGYVRPSNAAKTSEPFFVNGLVRIHERTPSEFLHFWDITAVAATLETSSGQKIYPDYDGTSKWLILEEPIPEDCDRLLIAHEDAVAFAIEHDLSQPELSTGRTASFGDDKPLHPKVRQGLLRLIGALAEMVLQIKDSGVSPEFESLSARLEKHLPERFLTDAVEVILFTGREELLNRGRFAKGQEGYGQSLLCVTGALAMLYIDQVGGNRLRHRSGDPNRNQLAERVQDHLATRGLDVKGFSRKSLDGKFQKAFEALRNVPQT